MLKIGDKEFRNLEEQVQKNLEDILALKSGIKIEKSITLAQLPTYTVESRLGQYFLVTDDGEKHLYLITLNDSDEVIAEDLGEYPARGPQGIQGVKGDKGDPGESIRGPQGIQGVQGVRGRPGEGWSALDEIDATPYTPTFTEQANDIKMETSAALKIYAGTPEEESKVIDLKLEVPKSPTNLENSLDEYSLKQKTDENELNEVYGKSSAAFGILNKLFQHVAFCVGGGNEAGLTLEEYLEKFPAQTEEQYLVSLAFNFAGGTRCKAKGKYSIAFGRLCEAWGANSTALGDTTKAEGNYSFVCGENSKSTSNAVRGLAIGNNNQVQGENAFCGGANSKALGKNAFCFGENCNAPTERSFIIGKNNNQSLGLAVFVTGEGNSANGILSVIFGKINTANGDYSFAEGYNNQANATQSHVGGSGSVANGGNSFVFGSNLISEYLAQAIFGKNNQIKADTLLEVGIGSDSSNRRNGFEVTNNGCIRLPNYNSSNEFLGYKTFKCVNGVLTAID